MYGLEVWVVGFSDSCGLYSRSAVLVVTHGSDRFRFSLGLVGTHGGQHWFIGVYAAQGPSFPGAKKGLAGAYMEPPEAFQEPPRA